MNYSIGAGIFQDTFRFDNENITWQNMSGAHSIAVPVGFTSVAPKHHSNVFCVGLPKVRSTAYMQ